MPTRLNAKDANFEEAFAALLDAKRETSFDVRDTVEKIVADVRGRGDEALVEYTKRFDRLKPLPSRSLSSMPRWMPATRRRSTP